MISEDLCLLATMKTGRPVKWEFTREEQFIGATTRHQMTTRVKLGAKCDGTLTAIEIHVVQGQLRHSRPTSMRRSRRSYPRDKTRCLAEPV